MGHRKRTHSVMRVAQRLRQLHSARLELSLYIIWLLRGWSGAGSNRISGEWSLGKVFGGCPRVYFLALFWKSLKCHGVRSKMDVDVQLR